MPQQAAAQGWRHAVHEQGQHTRCRVRVLQVSVAVPVLTTHYLAMIMQLVQQAFLHVIHVPIVHWKGCGPEQDCK